MRNRMKCRKNVLQFNTMASKLPNIILIFSVLFAVSCGSGSVYIPRSYEVKDPPPTKTSTKKKSSKKPLDLQSNEFSAPYNEVWTAAIESVKWLQWPPAFIDEAQGVIRLKEAYVYRKSGKLFRTYTWPSEEALQTSDINDYIEKVGRNRPNTGRTVFTQENLKMSLVKESRDVTRVNIDYSIRPYTFSGKIGYEIESNGYIESLLLERMRETIEGRPLAKY